MKRFLAILLVAMLLVSVVPATSMAATQYATVVGGWLRLRSSPSYSASTINSYYTGTRVEILSTSGSWCKVETPDGKTGYMYSDYLKLGGSSGGGTGGGTGGGIGTATVTSNNGYGVHLRKGPGTGYRNIRTIAVGTPVTVLERGSSWSKLNVNGTIGYMMNKFLNRGGESGGDEGIICYATIWSNNGYGVRVRTGPGTGYDRIGVYSVGTTVGVISQGATWDYIRVGSRTGYIMNQFLNYYASNKVTSVALNNLAPVVGNILAAQGVTPSQATVSYSWLVGGVEAGTAPTYLVTNADIGKSIQLRVTGTGKYTGSATSTATNAVLSNSQITRVDINGMLPVVGDTLSAAITPANATAIYAWLVDGKQMSNASTYLVTAADTGKEIQLIATGTGMFSGTVASLKTARVSASGKLANVRIKNISTGNYANGESPNAGDQLLAEINPTGATVKYSWKVNNVEVSTASTLPVQASWAGSAITLRADGIGVYTGYGEDQTLKVTSLITVTDLNLRGLTAPKNGDKPVSAITESSQFTGAVSWLPADAAFQPGKTYTATVGLSAKTGYTFTGVAQNAFRVDGAPANVQVTNAVNKGTVTVVFPTTGELPISNPAIGGVTVPAANAAPVTAVTATSEYTGTVTWSPSDAVFKPETEYTATITLKPQSGYTVAGIRQDWFTVAGAAATNATNGNVITARFPKTGKIGEIIITTGDKLQSGTVNQAYSVKLTATGTEPIAWSITKNSLPMGLMLDTQTGIISGTPQAAGDYTFEITATNATSTKSKSVSLAIAAVVVKWGITTQALADGTVGIPYTPQQLKTSSTEPITWSISSGALPGGLTLDGDTIKGTPTVAGTFSITVTATNTTGSDSKQFNVTIIQAGIAPVIATAALADGTVGVQYPPQQLKTSTTEPITWSISSGALPGGLTLDGDTIKGTPTAAGTFAITVTATNATGSDSKQFNVTISQAGIAPVIATMALADGMVGVQYPPQQLKTSTTEPITWSISSGALPGGLTLDGDTIKGTPTAAGTFSITVTATNATGSDSKQFTITISKAVTVPVIATVALADGVVGTPYPPQTFKATSTEPVTWSISSGALPGGLTLEGDTIKGTPTAAGTFSITVTVTNSFGADTKNFSIKVAN